MWREIIQWCKLEVKTKHKSFGFAERMFSNWAIMCLSTKTWLTLLQNAFQVIGTIYPGKINVGRLLQDNADVLLGAHQEQRHIRFGQLLLQ